MIASEPALILETALSIAVAARAIGSEQQLAGISVIIIDIDGAARLALRDDAQGRFGLDIATAKARTALGFLRSTAALAKIFTDPAAVAGISNCAQGGLLLIPGGLLILDKHGRRLGAIGVAGGAPSVDHEIAEAAVRAAGFTPGP